MPPPPGSSPRNLSLRKLAALLHMPPSTVSMALRDDPRISQEVRDKVAAGAKEHGYRPSQALSQAMSAARSRGEITYRETIACLFFGHPVDELLPEHTAYPMMRAMTDGVKSRAAELGCEVDFFSTYQQDPAALLRIMRSRGIARAICLMGVIRGHNFAFSRICQTVPMVFVGFPEIAKCPGTVVRPDYFAAGQKSFLNGWHQGFRRFILTDSPRILNSDQRYYAGFQLAAQFPTAERKAEVLQSPAKRVEDLLAEIEKYGDSRTCLVGGAHSHEYPEILDKLRQVGGGWIDWHANLYRDQHSLAGVDQRDYEQAREAVDLCLSSSLKSDQSSSAATSVHLLQPGWITGDSLPLTATDNLNMGKDVPFTQALQETHQPIDLKRAEVLAPPVRPDEWQPSVPPAELPAGTWLFHGVPFTISAEQSANTGSAAVILGGRLRGAVSAKAVSIPLPQFVPALYLLHGCADAVRPGSIGTLRFRFQDGTSVGERIVHRGNRNTKLSPEESLLVNWWPGDSIHFHNHAVRHIHLLNTKELANSSCYYIYRWENPNPDRPLSALEIELEPPHQEKYFLIALTAADPRQVVE